MCEGSIHDEPNIYASAHACRFQHKGTRPPHRSEVKVELHTYLGGLTRELKGKAYSVNGMEDHVHMLITLPPVISISDALRFIKSNSSGWIHERWPDRRSFAWQLGYGAFSVSKSSAHEVVQYIHEQEKHHRKMTFQEELIALLKKHEIEYDPRYIWD